MVIDDVLKLDAMFSKETAICCIRKAREVVIIMCQVANAYLGNIVNC